MNALLLETDQIECYAEDGSLVSCRGSGQDAGYAKTIQHPSRSRFKVMGDVVKDTLTRALWYRDANPAEFPLSWNEAREFVAALPVSQETGYGGWQLPSRRLLFSLLSHQRINPALPGGHPFENVFDGYYWTKDGSSRLPGQAWYVHLGGGRVHRGMKHGSYMVWPVSSPVADPAGGGPCGADRFTVNEGAVFDACTGLTWSRDADPAGRPLAWEEALSAIRAYNGAAGAGRGDWRLPNIRELESLVDLGFHSPALTAGHPFVNVRDAYWSSTTSVYEPRYAWTLYGRDGYVGVGFKPRADFYAWPVSGG